MEKTVKKNYYLTPAVKVVAFQVEGGFAPSDPVTVNVGTLPSSASNYTVNVVCTATDGRGTTASATRSLLML